MNKKQDSKRKHVLENIANDFKEVPIKAKVMRTNHDEHMQSWSAPRTWPNPNCEVFKSNAALPQAKSKREARAAFFLARAEPYSATTKFNVNLIRKHVWNYYPQQESSSKVNLSYQIFNFWAKPMEAQSALVRYYSSSRSAEAANLCSTSHLILRGSALQRSKILLGEARKSIFEFRCSKSRLPQVERQLITNI